MLQGAAEQYGAAAAATLQMHAAQAARSCRLAHQACVTQASRLIVQPVILGDPRAAGLRSAEPKISHAGSLSNSHASGVLGVDVFRNFGLSRFSKAAM